MSSTEFDLIIRKSWTLEEIKLLSDEAARKMKGGQNPSLGGLSPNPPPGSFQNLFPPPEKRKNDDDE